MFGYTSDKVRDFVGKNSTHLISHNFFGGLSAVASPVQGWLHVRFLPRVGNFTKSRRLHKHTIARVAVALGKQTVGSAVYLETFPYIAFCLLKVSNVCRCVGFPRI